MPGKIFTGTASWADPEFVKSWYPPDLPASHRLRFYAEHFPLVEVNSTFYRVPETASVRRWCEETPPGFLFNIKIHRLLSRHSTKPELLPPQLRPKAVIEKGRVQLTSRIEKAVAKEILKGLEPLRRCGKLGALLLQTSPAFRPKYHQLSELDSMLEYFDGERLAIELRNRDWVQPAHLTETKKFFTSRKLAFCMVDAPDDPHFTVMPGIDLVTSSRLAYIRAHGRNAGGYVRGRTVAERFDYVYSDAELKEIASRAEAASRKAKEVHVIYNNNKADYAPRAAAMFIEMIRPSHPEVGPARERQEQLAYA